tara:strand:+ start:519 stop:785 length:267 start_codon:yes stop_codon:yes gene_type:complete
MGGSLTKPNRIKDVYTKLVFYDGGSFKYDNGSADVTITSASSFSGDTNLHELDDINLTSPADGAVLRYDTGSSKWIDDNTLDGGSYQP